MSWLPNFLVKSIGRNLGQPTKSPVGLWVSSFLVKRNERLEINTVGLLNLEEHHYALEVGFGPGIGLQEACKYVSSGAVYGIDISDKMIEDASKRLSSEMAAKKLFLSKQSVEETSFADEQFDRIFHTNCYYFWPSKEKGAAELYRILKPDGFMVTSLNMAGLKEAVARGFLQENQVDPDTYQNALISVGFENVDMRTIETSGGKFQAIYAYKRQIVSSKTWNFHWRMFSTERSS